MHGKDANRIRHQIIGDDEGRLRYDEFEGSFDAPYPSRAREVGELLLR